jgi:hypothetical protein
MSLPTFSVNVLDFGHSNRCVVLSYCFFSFNIFNYTSIKLLEESEEGKTGEKGRKSLNE